LSILFSFLGGILMVLTVAPTNYWFFAWVAMIPLWLGKKKESYQKL